MDQELREYLDGMKAEMAGMNVSLRAEMAEMRAEIAELRAEIAKTKIELKAHNEDVETRLLTEFWKWARTSDIRARQQGSILNAQASNALVLDERIALIEERVSDLERRR